MKAKKLSVKKKKNVMKINVNDESDDEINDDADAAIRHDNYDTYGDDYDDRDDEEHDDAQSQDVNDEHDDHNADEKIEETDDKEIINDEIGRKRKKYDNESNKKKFKAPTAEELNNLRETETLFHSGLFRLQLNEMLAEVKLKEKCHRYIKNWIKQMENKLKSLSSFESRPITEQSWITTKVPLIQEPFQVKGNFQFEPPKRITTIGSYSLGTALRPHTVVDIAVEMPEECWNDNDHLNQRYHRKRALYLSFITEKLKSDDLIDTLSYTYFNGNHLKPILLIKPKGKVAKYCTFAIYPHPPLIDSRAFHNADSDTSHAPDKAFFKLTRYAPETNNVRENWFFKGKGKDNESISTPIYNSSVLHDMTLIYNYEHLSKVVSESESVRGAIILIKIWLRQRGLKSFGFVICMFITYLIQKRKISKNSSPYQIFRNTLLSIVQSQMDSEGITLCNGTETMLQHYINYFPVVFIDVTGHYNLCWEITSDCYDRLKHESKLTIEILDSNIHNSFESTFMKLIDFKCKFDMHFNVSLHSLLNCPLMSELKNEFLNHSGDSSAVFVPYLIRLCKRAVNDRILLIQHQTKSIAIKEWTVNGNPPHPNNEDTITIGLLIDPENALSNVTKGPSADTDEAKEFRKFWGDKSELRRFNDGLVCETVFWNAQTIADKRKIIAQSCEYIIEKFTKIPQRSITVLMTQFDAILEMPNVKFIDEQFNYGTGEESFMRIVQSYDSLAKKLRSVDDIALQVTGVHGISPVFRGTDVFPPLPLNGGKSKSIGNCNVFSIHDDPKERICKYFKPLEMVIRLEGSGKWPDDIDAFRRVKAAYHIELSKKLSSQFGLISAPTIEYIDILHDGYIFRIIVAAHKEITLLRRIKTSEGLIKSIESEKANDLERETEVKPRINGALNGLNQKYNGFGLTCRLVKRWFAAQMMFHYFDEIAIELMVSHLYINCAPYTTPFSPFIGFIRFICFLTSHNWRTEPLIVNLNNEMDAEKLSEIQSKFTSQRPTLPSMFISSPYDLTLSMFTKTSPSGLIVNRLIQVANATKETIFNQIQRPRISDFKKIFRPPMEIFDVIIRLKPTQITNPLHSIDYPQKFILKIPKFNPEINQKLPIVGFDPIDIYLKQLRLAYSDSALFFYDPFGGNVIGVLWKPRIFDSQPFRVSHINGCSLTSVSKDGTNSIVTNIEALLEDFAIIGQDIVEVIEARTENWINKLKN